MFNFPGYHHFAILRDIEFFREQLMKTDRAPNRWLVVLGSMLIQLSLGAIV